MTALDSESPTRKHRNEVNLHGVLARDPDVRYTTSGKPVANFTVATTFEKRTGFHRCTAWEKLAERVGKLKKGDFVQLTGRLQTRDYEQNGQKKYITEVVAWSLGDGTTEKNLHGVGVSDEHVPF
jgi:single-strand DNA-binding protein